jgi:hypothetical protein
MIKVIYREKIISYLGRFRQNMEMYLLLSYMLQCVHLSASNTTNCVNQLDETTYGVFAANIVEAF